MLDVLLPAVTFPAAFIRDVPFAVGTGPSGPGKGAPPAVAAAVPARIAMVFRLGCPATGVVGPSEVAGGGAPRELGSLPAAVSGLMALPVKVQPYI